MLRAVVGQRIVATLIELQFRVLAVAMSGRHGHIVVELPIELTTVKRIIGEAKRKSSRRAKEWLPGRIWAAGGKYKRVKDRSHQLNAVEYVLFDQGDDAWTWSFKDATGEGRFGRRWPENRKKNPGRR